MSSFVLGNSSNLEASIKRADRFAEALPPPWLKSGSAQPLKPLTEQLRKLAKLLESKRKDNLPGMVPLARRLTRALDKFGESEASQRLRKVFKLSQ